MSPFRDLFVALTDEAFAIAKGIGEQAVKKAQDVPKQSLSRVFLLLEALSSGPGERFMANRFGWSTWLIQRSAYRADIEVRALLHCGHVLHLEPIDERVLSSALRGEMLDILIDAIDRRVEKAPRWYCVQVSP
jgi:hypothetical protein